MARATHVHSTPRRTASLRKSPPAKPAARPLVDPIFLAIENHRKLDRVWLDLCPVLEQAELADRHAGLAALRRAHDCASDAVDNAAWKMARTEPTTAAGASELLTYITTGPITGLFTLGETDWHETAIRTAVASLAKITGQSQRAA
jgi:hypothetical protein